MSDITGLGPQLERRAASPVLVGFAALLVLGLVACSTGDPGDAAGSGGQAIESTPGYGSEETSTATPQDFAGLPDAPWLTDVAAEAGLDFVHDAGLSAAKHMPETLGGGAGFADVDGDGWLDVYMVQGGPVEPTEGSERPPNRLYRGNGDGTFTDVTEGSGAGDTTGNGMGVCFGDIDNDGDVDMYVTNYGADVLLRNSGDGTFTDVTAESGIDNPAWGTSCGFADYDRDGWLDLYVTNYVDYRVDGGVICGSPGQPAYCHPDAFDGVPDILYRNRGDGTFEIVTEAAGVRNADPKQSKGLGVVWLDFDDDGWIDLYVANDSTRNFLYRNEGDGTFTEAGLTRGGAFNGAGQTEAGMGVDAGDTDGDGLEDLYVTHLDFETNTLYRNSSPGFLTDETELSGFGAPSMLKVGFGTNFFDLDNDRDLDVFVANGHIIDTIAQLNPSLTFEQSDQLYLNRGDGRFFDASTEAGPYFEKAFVGRGTALGDYDEDGDLDLLVANLDGQVVLLRNDVGHDTPSLRLRLLTSGGRDAIGARARLVAGGRAVVATVRSARSYLSGSDPRLYFGLGDDADTIERLEIRWPDGAEQTIPADALRLDETNTIHQREDDGS